jgi:hypothetical protein
VKLPPIFGGASKESEEKTTLFGLTNFMTFQTAAQMKIHGAGTELLHADRQTDTVTGGIVTFCKFLLRTRLITGRSTSVVASSCRMHCAIQNGLMFDVE